MASGCMSRNYHLDCVQGYLLNHWYESVTTIGLRRDVANVILDFLVLVLHAKIGDSVWALCVFDGKQGPILFDERKIDVDCANVIRLPSKWPPFSTLQLDAEHVCFYENNSGEQLPYSIVGMSGQPDFLVQRKDLLTIRLDGEIYLTTANGRLLMLRQGTRHFYAETWNATKHTWDSFAIFAIGHDVPIPEIVLCASDTYIICGALQSVIVFSRRSFTVHVVNICTNINFGHGDVKGCFHPYDTDIFFLLEKRRGSDSILHFHGYNLRTNESVCEQNCPFLGPEHSFGYETVHYFGHDKVIRIASDLG